MSGNAMSVATLLTLAVVSVACSIESAAVPPPAEWLVPVDETTPRHFYWPVEDDDRTEHRIGLVEDLAIGERAGDDNYTMFQIAGVQADADGNLYVADGGNQRIQVFDENGEHVRTLGRAGQGPGELGRFFDLNVTGESVLAFDMQNRRVTEWSLEGEYRGIAPVTEGSFVNGVGGCPDGTWVARQTQTGEEPGAPRILEVSRRSSNLKTRVDYLEILGPGFQLIEIGGRRLGIGLEAGPGFAAGPSCELYVLAGGEYQVLALGPEGEARWAIWVPWQRESYSAAHREERLDGLRRNFPDVTESDIEWPDHHPAVSFIQADGHGHLYVFPFVYGLEEGQDRPVDVYSADGERLFTGTITARPWRAAVGDHVYSVREDEVTGETLVVRYRLEEPFR